MSGKGSNPRPFDVPREVYESNHARIFGERKKKPEPVPPFAAPAQLDAPAWALEAFLASYLLREMPSGTTIGNPAWWAGRIAAAIEREFAPRCRAEGGGYKPSSQE